MSICRLCTCLPFCQMSYISVCCGYTHIFSCTDPVLPTVNIHMCCQTYHIVCISVFQIPIFQGDMLTENYASTEKYQYFATSQMFGMSMHHSMLKCVILSTAFTVKSTSNVWKMEILKNVKTPVTVYYFATERHNKVLSTTSNLPLSPMYCVPLE